jgi:hypothetical protein
MTNDFMTRSQYFVIFLKKVEKFSLIQKWRLITVYGVKIKENLDIITGMLCIIFTIKHNKYIIYCTVQ